MDPTSDEAKTLLTMLLVGVISAIGNLLTCGEPISWRHALGRCITSGILAMAAGSVLVWLPNLSELALIGLSAAFASAGTSALERLLQKYIPNK